jgi:hypothetical protein
MLSIFWIINSIQNCIPWEKIITAIWKNHFVLVLDLPVSTAKKNEIKIVKVLILWDHLLSLWGQYKTHWRLMYDFTLLNDFDFTLWSHGTSIFL